MRLISGSYAYGHFSLVINFAGITFKRPNDQAEGFFLLVLSLLQKISPKWGRSLCVFIHRYRFLGGESVFKSSD